eukprot:8304352-Alexandrium_andersonii.AAC.1
MALPGCDCKSQGSQPRAAFFFFGRGPHAQHLTSSVALFGFDIARDCTEWFLGFGGFRAVSCAL